MKIHREGAPIIILSLVFALILGGPCFYLGAHPALSWILTLIPVGFAVFFMCFFRDPKRTPTGDSHKVTAPADGKIVIIQEVEEPEYFNDRRLQISVFMSFFNVHINWAPISGIVSFFRYHRGNYLAAWHPKSSTKNERTTIVFKNEDGTEVLCRQIAGLFARRVVCYAEYDKPFKAGQQIGFIKFGSRADVFLPLGTKVNVNVGDKVTGSETVIAELEKNTNI
ncbi:MAG TPA: phosphatidylserine decarboxylase family protein [Candidatus Coprenecus stercoravium]|uniref:Phosphatidylserine decarboxylase proenzyme n=1 Tax=Candidatus Coprenecus stercoravium TaxID=2840735 RepID=A0A9D2GRW1_9BACT|nr:phosphatidylserine decarboxylase family protein [Candidatus Coprenecus stercoravium]